MNDENVSISVIIPVYNTPIPFLDECLNSIFSSSYKKFEIIIVDDFSDQDVYEYLKTVKESDTRVKLIRLDAHRGAAEARNNGLLQARGEYLLFLDSDDIYDKNMFEKMYTRVTKVSADVGICAYAVFDNETKVIKGERKFTVNEQIMNNGVSFNDLDEKALVDCWSTAPQNKIFKRSFVLDNSLLYQSLQSSNDVYFTVMSAILAKKVAFCSTNENLVYIRTGTSCQISFRRHPMDYYRAVEKILKELEQYQGGIKRIQIQVLFINGAVFELNYSCNTTESYDFYKKMSKYCEGIDADSFNDESIKQKIKAFRNKPFDSYWYIYNDNYLAKYRAHSEEIVEKLKAYKSILIWGYGERGKALEMVLNDRLEADIIVFDRKFTEKKLSRLGNSEITYSEDLFAYDVIVATNNSIYEEINHKCKEIGIELINAMIFE